MQFKKVVPYKIRRLIPMLGMAGATLFMGGCDKEEAQLPHDVEITFTQFEGEKLFYDEGRVRYPSKLAQEYIEDPLVSKIYLVPEGSWNNYKQVSVVGLRKSTLEVLLNYSDKFCGRGDFDFCLGEASKVPEDSLWYVANGWTINKKYMKQNQH